MKIGLPKEIKDNEYRVGLTPAGVRALKDAGHDVLGEKERCRIQIAEAKVRSTVLHSSL